mgnify:FL=1
MANTKKKTKSSSSSSSSSSKKTVWGLNKISFWTIVAVTFLYAVALVLSACKVNATVVSALQGVATAIMIIIVAILAWRYVRPKPMVWKVLYIICLLIVVAGIIVPLVLG